MTDVQSLDRILELQFIVAWAGEARTEPPRMGWWRTNWVDENGGLDLLQRLAPRTAAWAQFELVRQAARAVDKQDLDRQANPEKIRTIFHLDPDLDRRLEERLFEHKSAESDPYQALPGLKITRQWSEAAFADYLKDVATARNFVAEPLGRRLQGSVPQDSTELVAHLVGGLYPLDRNYVRPHAIEGR